MPAHFAQYQPQLLRETRLGTMTLVVFPEPLSRMRSGMRDSVGCVRRASRRHPAR